jgi:hypothetical protein
MSSYRRQAYLDAPLEAAWELIGSPQNYPAWWPRIVEVRGERYEEGDEFAQVVRSPTGPGESRFLIERRDELREIRMSCQQTGMYAHWWLTAAQDGTFIELEMGMEPLGLRGRIMDSAIGRIYFRKWSEQSLDALDKASRERR